MHQAVQKKITEKEKLSISKKTSKVNGVTKVFDQSQV
jgi:hypothetical protein